MRIKNTIILYTILTNLFAGNAILFFAGSASFAGNINYSLMITMSITCIIVYLLVLKYLNLQNYTLPKLVLVSILCCMVIIFFGNTIALFLTHSSGFLSNLLPALVMGIAGNIILFPVSIVMGLLNLFWFSKLKNISQHSR